MLMPLVMIPRNFGLGRRMELDGVLRVSVA